METVETVKISDFLDEFGDALKEEVLKTMDPVYKPDSEDEWDKAARSRLALLNRKPFEGQTQRAILPVARLLYKENQRSSIIVGEMGTGKTFCSLAVTHLIPTKAKRIIVMCPGHLVMKWIREAKETIPGCTCINANGRSLRVLLNHKKNPRKPVGTEIWVIGKDRAKLSYRKRLQTIINHRREEVCPVCGREVEYFKTNIAPKCNHCNHSMWCADHRRMHRYSKAEFIKRYLPNDYFDLHIADEVHELKGGSSAQGHAFSCLANSARKTLALTGTLMGGYSKDLYFLLWRLFPTEMKKAGFAYRQSIGFARRYGVIETTYNMSNNSYDKSNVESIGKAAEDKSAKEAPGVSPLLLPDFLLEKAAFIRLVHVADELPDYDEIVVPVSMTPEQETAYRKLEDDLVEEASKALARGSIKLLGKMLQSLLAYPDGCRREEIVTCPNENGVEVEIASAPALVIETLPKEEQLLEILESERKEGRKVAIYLEHTGKRNLIPTLVDRVESHGFKPLVLLSTTIPPAEREEWLEKQMSEGDYDCLICNPNLVKTGLDLLRFPTIVYFQCGYSVYTLRQASRRSWRIGQQYPVRVFFMAYGYTMQERALSLMATKMESSLGIEGVLSDKGLAAMSESENSLVFEMAMALTGKTKAPQAKDAWLAYKQREIVSAMNLDAPVVTVQDVSVTTQTDLSSDQSHIHYKYIMRGRVYPRRNGTAVAYVNNTRFFLKQGVVYWKDLPVGEYDNKGKGTINKKPIHIFKPEGESNFILAELQRAA